MKKENELNEDSLDYNYFITYEPKNVKFVSEEESDLINEYYLILSALQNDLMSVKDIHNLYHDQKTGKHTYTLKTIYRYLEKLENAGLATMAGYREKVGTRSCEKVYGRTAKIFFPEIKKEDQKWWELESGKEYAHKLKMFLTKILQVSEPDEKAFYEIFKQFYELLDKTKREIPERIIKNSDFADFLSQIDIRQLNSFIDLISVLIVLLQEPNLFNQIQNLLRIDQQKKKL